MNTQTKPLDRLTLVELLDLYGRTVLAMAEYDDTYSDKGPEWRQLRTDRIAIESEARRRDQLTWLPAQPQINREPDGEILFA